MKNVHVIPTEKPSKGKLVKGKNLHFYKDGLSKEFLDIDEEFQHIYIISDEEIKDGDWILEISDNSIFTIQIQPNTNLSKYKKVILTTDQDLIKDGVQAIDDEFLEWFVKNPSCEFVVVKNISIKVVKGYKNNGEIDCYYTNGYEIIIPQEEPKQETLEEAAERVFKDYSNNTSLAEGHYDYMMDKEDFKEASLEIAKWQSERSYSKEEVDDLLDRLLEGNMCSVVGEELIEQFKKK